MEKIKKVCHFCDTLTYFFVFFDDLPFFGAGAGFSVSGLLIPTSSTSKIKVL